MFESFFQLLGDEPWILISSVIFALSYLVCKHFARLEERKRAASTPSAPAPTPQEARSLRGAWLWLCKKPQSALAQVQLSGHARLPDKFLRKHAADLATHHTSALVRQLASELDQHAQAKFQARTAHYLKLRGFLQATAPHVLVEYDLMHPMPERARLQITRAQG
jgi:hypothetical protein